MHPALDYTAERRELEAILASGILSRAPNLAHLLTYICAKHFEGAAEQIKEYNIAVDALGRPPDFDQKRDSIVRVEAHRLRKRLREYYDAAGADHALRIDIPPGQYAPRFLPGTPVPRQEPLADATVAVAVTPEAHAIPGPIVQNRRGSRIALMPTMFLLVFCTGAIALWNNPIGKTTKVAASP